MTRLDQAFIRIYGDRDTPTSSSADWFRPAAEADPSADVPSQPPGDAGIDQPAATVQASPADIELPCLDEDVIGPDAADKEHDDRDAVRRLDQPADSGLRAWRLEGRAVPPAHVRLSGDELPPRVEYAADDPDAEQPAVGQRPADRAFLPMLQVDRFDWPQACLRLSEMAADQLDGLTSALRQAKARGKRVVAVGGCRRGEGATTVLLSAARRLAQLGLRVVMVDANLADPQLARRLGLLAETGWEDVLAGRLPLEEVVVESVGDRLAVLPVCRAYLGSDADQQQERRLVEGIQALAAHYDLVLLDPGPLEELGALGAPLARGSGGRLNAIALVHHRRLTPPEDLDQVRRSLAATEIAQLGVIENFACE
jgi:Mrp family chromosome partitioning ATPase